MNSDEQRERENMTTDSITKPFISQQIGFLYILAAYTKNAYETNFLVEAVHKKNLK